MELIAGKSRLKGTVKIPASKSHTIRAIAIASLATGKSAIRNPLVSNDTLSAAHCYSQLGAKIDPADPTAWFVTGTGGRLKPLEDTIDVGNSGTTLRLATGSASLLEQGQSVTFTGDEQTLTRPLGPLINSLNELGAHCVSLKNNDKAPVKVTGKLSGGKTSISAFTSQYLSSLLLCTPLAEHDSEIDVTLLHEPGYVQMTLDWLDKQNIEYKHDELRNFKIKGKQAYKPFNTTIPADFSSATFFLCAACLCGEGVTLQGLDFLDSQPDKAVVDYLKAMGADITIGELSITVKVSQLKGIDIDMNGTPDALPAMAVTAAFAEGTTRLLNVPQARTKETDRIKAMACELKKMDIDVEELPDGLIIRRSNPRAAKLHGWADHRIVMALSLAGLCLDGQCVIDTAEAMNVTFPEFVNLMKSIGAKIELK
jgi:3-phosphoshikimate 1-carboxyvinyltransferase